jgi:SAM-dependent methyltransferase
MNQSAIAPRAARQRNLPGAGQGKRPTSSLQSAWEAAYCRFESPEQERAKFVKRLRRLGVAAWDRDLVVTELFCGRGNALHAWHALGFRHLEGLDLSAELVARYRGPAHVRVGDARQLPYADGSRDIVAVQGGLHHLRLMADLEQVAAEIHRVLKPGGRLLVVEPWQTPFLGLVHRACRSRPLRRAWAKLDALATMIEHERETYEDWLSRPAAIRAVLGRIVEPLVLRIGWGKLMLVGRRREA